MATPVVEERETGRIEAFDVCAAGAGVQRILALRRLPQPFARAHSGTPAVAAISRRLVFGPISYILAFALSFVNVIASFGLCMLLALFWAAVGFERT